MSPVWHIFLSVQGQKLKRFFLLNFLKLESCTVNNLKTGGYVKQTAAQPLIKTLRGPCSVNEMFDNIMKSCILKKYDRGLVPDVAKSVNFVSSFKFWLFHWYNWAEWCNLGSLYLGHKKKILKCSVI